MQDNWNTEDINDQAWAKMKAMLDQEMPVKGDSKRKPVFWWFWSAAVIILGLITVAILSLPPQQVGQEALEQSFVTPAAQAQVSAVQDTDTSNEATTGKTGTTESVREPLPSLATVQNESLASGQKATAEGRPLKNTGTSSVEASGLPYISKEGRALENGELTAVKLTEPSMEIEAQPETVIPPATSSKAEEMHIASIATLNSRTLDLPDLPLLRTPLYNPKKTLFIPLEVHLGLISYQTGGLNGVFAELRSGLKLGHGDKWSLQSGLGLHYQQQPFTVSYQNRGGQVMFDAANPGNLNAGNGKNVDIPAEVAAAGVHLKAAYLDLPLVLHWRSTPRWSVEAGARLSLRLFSSWKINGQQEFASLGGAYLNYDRSNISFAQLASNGQPASFTLSDFYSSGLIGIAYQPRPDLRFRLQYQHSMSNLLDSKVFKSTDRSIWLSAGLSF